MKRRNLVEAAFALATVIIVIVAAVQLGNQPADKDRPAPQDAAASENLSSPTIQPTPSVENVVFSAVGIKNTSAATVSVYSQSGQEITVKEIILEDQNNAVLASDNTISKVLPADGSKVEITIDQDAVDFCFGGVFKIMLVTEKGATFTSPETSPMFY
jgi:hypothetical protein